MYPAQLKINTSLPVAGSSTGWKQDLSSSTLRVDTIGSRLRSISNASSTSSYSIVSPRSSSTNASTSSLVQPLSNRSTPSPDLDESFSRPKEYVLALHDYTAPHQDANCLSFRAGQVIHVLNRDQSGWWDGELEGRRGWFPSNYINDSSTEEETLQKNHAHKNSSSSVTSWASGTTPGQHSRNASLATTSDVDSYFPPVMDPLAHGLSLLQSAVRANRVSHFQPSTACIISCVRQVLSATNTLLRSASILKRFPPLAQERSRVLAILASLVAQAKKASEGQLDEDMQEIEITNMVRLGGQVFSSVRRFLAVAVQCGIELPDRRYLASAAIPADPESETLTWRNDDTSQETPNRKNGYETRTPPSRTPRPPRGDRSRELPSTPGSGLRTKSMGDLRSVRKSAIGAVIPTLPSRADGHLRESVLRRQKPPMAHTSSPSSSSVSSNESFGAQVKPTFICGPCTTAQVMEALRSTHDQYLSTIAAFIGHAHSHSRTSHASSTGHMYDLVREIVEMVCKLLTIVEAALQHPDVPDTRLANLRAAKEGLYTVTSTLAEAVRLLTLPLPLDITDEQEKNNLLRSATGALKAGADCVAAVKMCLTRSLGERPFILQMPAVGNSGSEVFAPNSLSRTQITKSMSMDILNTLDAELPMEHDQLTHAISNGTSSESDSSGSMSKSTSVGSADTNITSPDDARTSHLPPPLLLSRENVERDLTSPTSFARTDDDGTTWEGSTRGMGLEVKIAQGELPPVPNEPSAEALADPIGWMLSHDYALDDVAYNSEGFLVGATLPVLVEKMTPHDSIVDPAFSAVFFLTFRMFSSPLELVDAVIARYNLLPPRGLADEEVLHIWQQRKGIPVRLRVSNFIKMWVESYWRNSVDVVALPALTTFTRDGLALMFPGPAQRILDLLEKRREAVDMTISPKGDRTRDPGMSINPPSTTLPTSEIPRPSMTKALLAALRAKNFASIAITDFDALELARQLTIMECTLYCSIQPEEVLESGQDGVKPPVNVRALSSLSTVITGWVAESILDEHDIKKRTILVKFFIKVADRCTSLSNFSTSRSILAALDSSTISRLHQTWMTVPQKQKTQLESLRRLADHGRNYREYRGRLRKTVPPAVPFLGLYLTDVTFCREGNPSHRASPVSPDKKLINFNKYHKLARIVQDMQRFQVPYTLKTIPEVQAYLDVLFNGSKRNGDLQDLYRRSLLVEPKQPADAPPANVGGDVRQLFNWATRTQSQPPTSS